MSRRYPKWLILGLEVLFFIALYFGLRAWLHRDVAQGEAPVFHERWLQGERFSLSDYRGAPLLLHFWAPWCGPCRMMAPAFEQAATQLEPHVRLLKVNTEEQQAIGAQFGIRSIPTMVLFAKGRELDRMSGAMNAPDIVAWARQHLR